MKTIKTNVKINSRDISAQDDSTIRFNQPLAITDNSTQWNGTQYDIDSLDMNYFDGIVSANHGQNIQDAIGKVVGLKKVGNKIIIEGIKYATKINPIAQLAYNLMKEGFVTGVSIETVGPDPDSNLTWKNHKLSGLSQVLHPNNTNAYAVVSNSINQARKNGLDITELEGIKQDLTRLQRLNNLVFRFEKRQ